MKAISLIFLILSLLVITQCEKPRVVPKSLHDVDKTVAANLHRGDIAEDRKIFIPKGKPYPLAPIPAVKKPENSPWGKTFIWVINQPDTIDPGLIHETAGEDIARQLFEGLLAPNVKTGAPVTGVAERFDVSDEGTVFTFFLRKDARWSNGRPVTAFDFEYAWKRVIEPETGSENAQFLWCVVGARDYSTRKSSDFSKVGIKAVDDHTFQVKLIAPTPYFPFLATMPALAPVPREAIKTHGNQWTRAGNILTNGPFLLDSFSMSEGSVVLKKSPTYWDKANVWLEEVRFVLSSSESFAVDKYETGGAHYVPGIIPLNKIIQFLKDGRNDFHIDPILCIYHYAFNLNKPPFGDLRVRKAINLAINKEKLVNLILQAGQLPAYNFVPDMFRDITGYIPVTGDGFNPEKARQLLAEAGYSNGKGLPPIEMIYNTHEGHRLIAEFIQRDLKENLGINISILNMEWKTLLEKLHSHDFQMGKQSWCADYPDPLAFIELWYKDNEVNYAGFRSSEFDALIDSIRVTAEPMKRNQLLNKAEAILVRELPAIPIYFFTRAYLLKPYVRGIESHFMGIRLARYIYFEK